MAIFNSIETSQPPEAQESNSLNESRYDFIKDDPAFKDFLSKKTKNDSIAFQDYPATRALVDQATDGMMRILGIKL